MHTQIRHTTGFFLHIKHLFRNFINTIKRHLHKTRTWHIIYSGSYKYIYNSRIPRSKAEPTFDASNGAISILYTINSTKNKQKKNINNTSQIE